MTTGLFAQTATEATRHEDPGTTPRYSVIVSRDRPELFDDMVRRFSNSPDTSVVFDQEVDRRDARGDHQRRRAIDVHLWVDGYAIIRTN